MSKNNSKPSRRITHVSSRDKTYFSSNLASLLEASVPVGDIFESLQETTHSRRFKAALKQMGRDVDEGMPLWKALDRSGVASDQMLALVKLGEGSGNLVGNLRVAARQEEKQRLLQAKIISALLYPAFVLGITIVVGLGVAWFLLPRLSETFTQLHVKLPLISRIIMNVGNFLGENGIWLVPGVILSSASLVYILFVARGTRNIGRRLLFHTPGISRLLSEVEVARFGYQMGTLLEAGMTVMQSLSMLEEAVTVPKYRKFYKYLRGSFDDGYSLKSSLNKYRGINKLLPPAVQQIIIAGERSGGLSDAFLRVGKIYEEKSDITTQNLEAILEPVLLVLVWFGVLVVAVGVILPIYSLVSGLQ